jgi:hypothetical protein
MPGVTWPERGDLASVFEIDFALPCSLCSGEGDHGQKVFYEIHTAQIFNEPALNEKEAKLWQQSD